MKKIIKLINWKLTPTSHKTHWGGCTRRGSQGKVGITQEMTEAEPNRNSAAQRNRSQLLELHRLVLCKKTAAE